MVQMVTVSPDYKVTVEIPESLKQRIKPGDQMGVLVDGIKSFSLIQDTPTEELYGAFPGLSDAIYEERAKYYR
jgi:hypothetical protein